MRRRAGSGVGSGIGTPSSVTDVGQAITASVSMAIALVCERMLAANVAVGVQVASCATGGVGARGARL